MKRFSKHKTWFIPSLQTLSCLVIILSQAIQAQPYPEQARGKINTRLKDPKDDTSLDETCYIQLKPDITWISFPRLARYQNNTVPTIPVLERINWYPNAEIDLNYKNQLNKLWDGEDWSGFLDEVQTTLGYILDLSPVEGPAPVISLYGSRLEENYKFDLSSGENWIGYFVGITQMPEDCIPPDLWLKITMLQTQFWSMVRDGPPCVYPNDCWIIDGYITPFEYGDMIKITLDHPYYDFSWINSGEEGEGEGRPVAEYFNYEEKANYVPFFVEMDSSSQIQEIGIMANGECKGAAVRFAGDTLVEVNGYLDGVPPGALIEFETWEGYKSAGTGKNETDYVVYNPGSRKMEKRKIYADEGLRYYIVSLKNGEKAINPSDVTNLTCVPNPAQGSVTISFVLNASTRVWLEVYAADGRKVAILLQGNLPEGDYQAQWQSGSNGEGVYIVKLRTGNGALMTREIVVLK